MSSISQFQALFNELEELYDSIYAQWEATRGEQGCENRYWQGKKDGLRLALALMAPLLQETQSWQRLALSSRESYVTDDEYMALVNANGGNHDDL